MEGFHSSKHTQILKVAMLLTVVENGNLALTEDMLKVAIGLIERIEPGMEELYKGAGRNELAQPTERLIVWLNLKGGVVPEKEFLLTANRDMDPREAYSVMQHLQKTDQIVILEEKFANGRTRRLVATKTKADSLASGTKPVPPSS